MGTEMTQISFLQIGALGLVDFNSDVCCTWLSISENLMLLKLDLDLEAK